MKRAGSIVGGELERLVQAWLELCGWKAHRAAATGFIRTAGGRGFVRSHDLFGCFDFIAARPIRPEARRLGDIHPETWALQVTAPADRSRRREKIVAAGPWPASWRVSILHHTSECVIRNTMHLFHVENLSPGVDASWGKPESVGVDVAQLRAHRSAKARARKERKSS